MSGKINEQFCIKVHNIITSSNFLIYEGKSFLTAAHIVKWNGWCFFYCFTASLSTSSLSRPNNLQLASNNNNNTSVRQPCGRDRTLIVTHTHEREKSESGVAKSFSIEIETFPRKCRPRPSVCVRQFPSFSFSYFS